MAQEIKTIKELEDRTDIQDWANGSDSMDDLIDSITASCPLLTREMVTEWAEEEVAAFNDTNEEYHWLFQ